MPYFAMYVLVELAAVVALATTVGFGWTLLAVLATFVVGVALAGSQIRHQFRRLRSGLATPQGAVTDGGLVALGTVLVVIPGLVSSVLGLLLLLPPTRAMARPLLTMLAARGLARRAPLLTVTTLGADGVRRFSARRDPYRTDYIDGEVVDVHDPKRPPPSLPPRPLDP